MQNEGWNLEHTYTKLPEMFYRNQKPEAAPVSQMCLFNHELAESLGLNANKLSVAAGIFAGTQLPYGAKPISQAYAGYQFGHFTMLGDGRAVVLGEQITPSGNRFDIQLKGSGATPFSRGGDGYAALSPMLREYIISEAMFHLGIPTTRSLAVALTGRNVIREKILPGAVLTRVASSHIRVGTFNYAAAYGTQEDVRTLVDYCIWRHFPELEGLEDRFHLFAREVARLQAELIAKWQLVGFVHGVMNTDNMAICGETIDYGPCAFLDVYAPNTVFSSIDTEGRYAYKNQPKMAAWNLAHFAGESEVSYFWECYERSWLQGMKNKLGILNDESEDAALISELLDLMATHKLDYTNTFRSLLSPISELKNWQAKWAARLSRQPQINITDIMNRHNPAVIPRNHRVEEALAAAENGDMSLTHKLLAALSKPYQDNAEYSQPPKVCGNYRTFCGT